MIFKYDLPRLRHFVAANTSAHVLVHGATQHNQLTLVIIMKSSPCVGTLIDITMCFLHTKINVPLTLPPKHPSPSTCVMQLESWFVSEVTVWPVVELRYALTGDVQCNELCLQSCLHSLLGDSTGEFEALQPIVLPAFGAVDLPLAPCMLVHFFKSSLK